MIAVSQSTNFTVSKDKQPIVTDQPHVEGITIHHTEYIHNVGIDGVGIAYGFSVTLYPEHIQALEAAIEYLRKYQKFNTCPDCNGTGNIDESVCPTCGGERDNN